MASTSIRPKIGARVRYIVFIEPKEESEPGKVRKYSQVEYEGEVLERIKREKRSRPNISPYILSVKRDGGEAELVEYWQLVGYAEKGE